MDEQTRNYAQSNLTLPHDIVPLPSEGVFYKNKKKSGLLCNFLLLLGQVHSIAHLTGSIDDEVEDAADQPHV